MKKKLLLITATAFVLLTAFTAGAQNNTKISGLLKDENGNAVKSATVMLHRAKDSVLVKTEITDGLGNYDIIGIKPGSYFIRTSFVGTLKASSPVFSVEDGQTVSVPTISLKSSDKSLQGVTVTGSYTKPMIEVKADRTIFNVESSINSTGSNAFELLQKSPGVITDKDDNISLKGKNGVRVYIDGRQTQMNNTDLAAYLRSINSVDIESIEMISNPSAKYDASGNAGIINIKLKKNKKFGTNGTISAGLNVGETPKTNSSLSLNYRNKKANLFSNYSNNWGENINHFYLYRKQNDSSYDQNSIQTSNGWSHNLKAGADFFLTKEQTIGFIATVNLNDNTGHTESRTPIGSISDGKIGQILYASNNIPSNTKNLDLNFNYGFNDTSGHSLTLDADYGSYISRRTSYQPNSYFAPYPETFLFDRNYRNETPTDIHIYTAKIDYETPVKKGKLGLGAKISNVKTDNTFNFYNVISGYNIIDMNRSNTFGYKENINALYLNFNHPIAKKWAIQAGVRMENTVSDGLLSRADGQKQPDDEVKRNYTDFFPSAALTFNHSMKHIFNLTYSRRIDRPNYQDLNPFENKLDELTFQKGNAFLRPQYTNSIELTHTFKYKFNTTLSYSHITDYKAQVIDTAQKNKSFITQKNLATQDITNINFSLPFTITKWWTLYSNLNVYNSRYQADFGPGKKIDINVQAGNLYMSNSFTLGGGYIGEVSGFVTTPTVWAGTFKSKALGTLDLGLQKQLFKGKGNFKVSYTDLLKTLHWAGVSDYGAAYIAVHGNWESQQLRMNLTYRFGNNQVKAARQRKSASEDENKRTQSSGGIGGGN